MVDSLSVPMLAPPVAHGERCRERRCTRAVCARVCVCCVTSRGAARAGSRRDRRRNGPIEHPSARSSAECRGRAASKRETTRCATNGRTFFFGVAWDDDGHGRVDVRCGKCRMCMRQVTSLSLTLSVSLVSSARDLVALFTWDARGCTAPLLHLPKGPIFRSNDVENCRGLLSLLKKKKKRQERRIYTSLCCSVYGWETRSRNWLYDRGFVLWRYRKVHFPSTL